MSFHNQQRVRVVHGPEQWVGDVGYITGFGEHQGKSIFWVHLDAELENMSRWFYEHDLEAEEE